MRGAKLNGVTKWTSKGDFAMDYVVDEQIEVSENSITMTKELLEMM